MAKWNPFSKSYEIRCEDGSTKTVYKKVEDAFPLSIQGYETNISANLDAETIGQAGLESNLKRKVESLLYGLDEINNGLMLSFRSAYVGYQTDPCTNNDFFLDQITKINEEQRRLRSLKMQIRGYVELAKSNPGDSKQLAELYYSLVNQIGASNMDTSGVVEAINNATDAARHLMEDE